MFAFKITKRGDKFAQMERKAKPEAARIARDAATATVDIARQLVPVKTGALRASIFYQQLSETRYQVGATEVYAPFIEFGTANSHAQPFLIPALELARREFEAGLADFFNRVTS